ncbi:uncharacterized protein LOC114201558 isoform X4 [Eumetopias jubatus]|uniref:uncharacterized protein LOC114201558 isoform X4 n=1 Tax=Eumetopias jubatus TaxID=34886 RepID=UPI001015F929|nr:uncharacterized protein LOC114201558 isoform X4 [Eumetopias jubatus]
MLRSWEHYQVRGQLWALLLDTEKVKSTKRGVYAKVKEQAQLFSRDIRQIDLDVNRTFQNHVMFRDRYGVRLFHSRAPQTAKVLGPSQPYSARAAEAQEAPGRGTDGHWHLHLQVVPPVFHRPAGPEEFPTKPLGLEPVPLAPKPRLPSCVETLPRVDGLASPGPATQHEQPGPLPGQAILKAEEPLQEGTSTEPSAAPLQPGGPRAQPLALLPPAQDP